MKNEIKIVSNTLTDENKDDDDDVEYVYALLS